MLDARSPLAVKILEANPRAYEALVAPPEGNAPARALLEGLSCESLLLPASRSGRADPQAMLAGLWLWHDWLHESHVISQGLDTPTGSFWHAIMHRREGDFSNSRYWYARVGDHPVIQTLGQQAGAVVNSFPADNSVLRIIAQGWKPAAWVELVESVHQSPSDPRHALAVRLQQLEWKLLFDYCARA